MDEVEVNRIFFKRQPAYRGLGCRGARQGPCFARTWGVSLLPAIGETDARESLAGLSPDARSPLAGRTAEPGALRRRPDFRMHRTPAVSSRGPSKRRRAGRAAGTVADPGDPGGLLLRRSPRPQPGQRPSSPLRALCPPPRPPVSRPLD